MLKFREGSKKDISLFRFVASLLVFFLIFGAFIPVYANNELEDYRRQQQETEDRLEREREDLEMQRSREEDLKIELNELDRQIRVIRSELTQLNREIVTTERHIRAAEHELKEAEERLAYREELLMKRLRVIHERGTVNYIEVLMDSSSFSEFLTRFYYLRTIVESDNALIKEVEGERDLISEKKRELEINKAKLENMHEEVDRKRLRVSEIIEERSHVLELLREEIKNTEQAIADLETDAAELKETIDKMIEEMRRRETNNEGTRPEGALLWPVENPCYITSPFGWRSNPFSGGRQWHGGLDVGTYGRHNEIYAAERGTVMFARYSGGYGNYIMVDHGGGMMTLYAHLSSMGVTAGQVVSRGETIGRAGTTGASTGVHLHFEVWIDGVRQDPMAFL